MSFGEIAGILLGLLSVVLSWYYGTRKNRLRKKLKEKQYHLAKIEAYNTQTGYKNMLHDCFLTFSYVGSVVLVTIGVKSILASFISNADTLKIIEFIFAGVYVGSGFVLFDLLLLLSSSNKHQESVKTLKSKINKIKNKIN